MLRLTCSTSLSSFIGLECPKTYKPKYNVSHPLESRDYACLHSELANGWRAGSGIYSALGRLGTPEFIYEKSVLSSGWDGQYNHASSSHPIATSLTQGNAVSVTDLADGPGVRVEVDGVVVALEAEVPARLDVRDLHGVADRLHMRRRRPRLRPEQCRHARPQQVAHCEKNKFATLPFK